MSTSSLDIAWVAGIYEGEGTCHCEGSTLQVCIGQKDRWLPEMLLAIFGGRIYGPYSSSVYQWRLIGRHAAAFLMTIYVFLSPRRKAQVAKALDTWKSKVIQNSLR